MNLVRLVGFCFEKGEQILSGLFLYPSVATRVRRSNRYSSLILACWSFGVVMLELITGKSEGGLESRDGLKGVIDPVIRDTPNLVAWRSSGRRPAPSQRVAVQPGAQQHAFDSSAAVYILPPIVEPK
ncbi:unnamed protein product [Spirodela intermedia]|uniref:Uncharacterized protein n=1 Tax=Spirodela intermedia TaxID=51605 RepID=A0ABN7ECW8_SPIIN|nr:unnamed protein product [Spirodela intermedia]